MIDTTRPSAVCRALLSALESAEGRRRSRKRDQTPDAIGLSMKRRLLELAVADDPEPEAFEAWLLDRAFTENGGSGCALAMARAVLDEWRLANEMPAFASWLEGGAPSDDVNRTASSPPAR